MRYETRLRSVAFVVVLGVASFVGQVIAQQSPSTERLLDDTIKHLREQRSTLVESIALEEASNGVLKARLRNARIIEASEKVGFVVVSTLGAKFLSSVIAENFVNATPAEVAAEWAEYYKYYPEGGIEEEIIYEMAAGPRRSLMAKMGAVIGFSLSASKVGLNTKDNNEHIKAMRTKLAQIKAEYAARKVDRTELQKSIRQSKVLAYYVSRYYEDLDTKLQVELAHAKADLPRKSRFWTLGGDQAKMANYELVASESRTAMLKAKLAATDVVLELLNIQESSGQ